MRTRTLIYLLPWPVFLAILYAAPLFVNRAGLSFLFFLLMWVSLSQSFNMFTGLTGYVNFGFVSFYGLGAYGMVLSLLKLNTPLFLSILIGGIVSSVFAFVISLPILKLRGAYFAIAMLSLTQAIFVIFNNWEAVNAATGYTIPVKYYDPVLQYYTIATIALVTVLVAFAITRTRLGLALSAIRQSEDTAESIGINTALYKSIAFAISAFFSGLAGGAAVWAITIVDPPSAFDTLVTLTVISMTMLGGVSTILGPVIGACILYSLEYYLGISYPYLHLIVFGVIIIAVVLAIPKGIVGTLQSLYSRMSGKNE